MVLFPRGESTRRRFSAARRSGGFGYPLAMNGSHGLRGTLAVLLRKSRRVKLPLQATNEGSKHMAKIQGGCLCGAVRYRSDAEPAMQVVCHCKTCQKNFGSAFSMNVAVPLDSLHVEGQASCYDDRSGASGQAFHRHYCAACGSHVYSHGPAYGELAFIKRRHVRRDSARTRDAHMDCEKLPWVSIPKVQLRLPGNPG